MDQLTQTMERLKVYDTVCNEVKELAYFAELNTVTDADIVATDERYRRYLRNWKIDYSYVSYGYIYEWLAAYLSSESKSEKINLMCVIDCELYNIVCRALNS